MYTDLRAQKVRLLMHVKTVGKAYFTIMHVERLESSSMDAYS